MGIRRNGAACVRVAAFALVAQATFVTTQVSAAPAGAAPLGSETVAALDGAVQGTDLVGDPAGVTVLSAPQGSFNGFPTQGDSALIISTGDASVVADPQKGARESVVEGDQIGTDLAGGGSADGNDLTQVRIDLAPPPGSTCVAFDFLFLSEEYPNYVGQEFNDIFTAEIDETRFALNGNQVSAPNNFAYGEDGDLLSVNTFSRFVAAEGSTLNGKSPALSAVADLRDYTEEGYPLFLTVQDLGDSDLDSAVVVDNLRYTSGSACTSTVVSIVDSDGDGLSDEWETNGIDYDGDGTPEVDLPAMGADPQRKDIFLEIDWMYEAPTCVTSASVQSCPANEKDLTPRPEAIAAVVEAFADAPVDNPDGSRGIDLHVDAGRDYPMDGSTTWGDLSRAGAVPYAPHVGSFTNGLYDWSDFDAIKATEFEVERGDAFHYLVYVHRHGVCTVPDCSSGISRGLPGGDLILSNAWGFSLLEEAGTIMHELGHNLGLTHAADRNHDPRYQDGYLSVMNYCYQFPGVGPGGRSGLIAGLDYSRGAAQQVEVPCAQDWQNPSAKSQVDSITYDDWSNIVFDGGSIGDLGDSGGPPTETEGDEFTQAEAERLGIASAPGDGSATVVGPDLFAAGLDGQSILVDVTNRSNEETTYRLEIGDPWMDEPLEVTVPPHEGVRAELPVVVASTTDGPTAVTVSLFNGDVLLSESTRELQAVDLRDEAIAADVQRVIDEIRGTEGFDAEATALLEEVLEPVFSGEVTPEPEEGDDGLPTWLFVAIGAGVVAVLAVAVLLSRRRPTGPARPVQ